MKRLTSRLLVGTLLGMAVYVAISLYADVTSLVDHLERFPWILLLPVLGLTLTNYLLRFGKWHILLRRTGARVSVGRSLGVFLSGMSMGITPGKIGELLKSYLLKQSNGIPMASSAPVVIAERVTDLVALLLLCLFGTVTGAPGPTMLSALAVAAVAVVALTASLSSRRWMLALGKLFERLPLLRRLTPRIDQFALSMSTLLSAAPLALAVALSVAAWLCECLGFWLVLRGVLGQWPPLHLTIFIYSATTVLGALSFLPGGLGVTEGSMTLLLMRMVSSAGRSAAAAATILIRLCTLWFGVILGLVVLAVLGRKVPGELDLHR